MPAYIIAGFVERSQGLPLMVRLTYAGFEVHPQMEGLEELLNFRDRWDTLHMALTHDAANVLSSPAGVWFPLLKEIFVCAEADMEDDHAVIDEWVAPLLHTINWDGFICSFEQTRFQVLTCFSYTHHQASTIPMNRQKTDSFVSCILRMPKLRSLSIRSATDFKEIEPFALETEFHAVPLPTVTHFRFRVGSSSDPFRQIVWRIRVPSLNRLTVDGFSKMETLGVVQHFADQQDDGRIDWVEARIRLWQDQISQGTSPTFPAFISSIAGARMHTLVLNGFFLQTPTLDNCFAGLPSLRSVTLIRTSITAQFILAMLTALEGSGIKIKVVSSRLVDWCSFHKEIDAKSRGVLEVEDSSYYFTGSCDGQPHTHE